jgi:hypothetical protein
MKKLKVLLALSLGVLAALTLTPGKAAAIAGSDFRAGNIIDDSIFFNSNTMTPDVIQAFLNSMVPVCDTNGTQPSGHAGYPTRADWGRANGYPPTYTCLKDYVQSVPGYGPDAYCDAGMAGGNYSAAQIIYLVSRSCGVNPQTMVVLLQKEQGLITDEWPWATQYRSATGFGCPDTAPCDAQYYGFFNQVYHAARQFKVYARKASIFNFQAGTTDFIQYNPNSACNGTNVYLQNQATAALYNYTPYQPNAAALNNLYGTGDNCSAYGNRNFWRMFNDWFGATHGNFVLAKPNNSGAQYIICNGIKYSIPSPSIITAWGLDRLGAAAELDPGYVNSLPNGPTLGRIIRPSGSFAIYFLDGGNRYRFTSVDAINEWGMSVNNIIDVPADFGTFPFDQGNLSFNLKSPNDNRIFLMDGGAIEQFGSPQAVAAWEGDNPKTINVSNDYFAGLSINPGLISSNIVQNGSNTYMVDSGRKELLNAPQQALFSGLTPATVSNSTASRLVSTLFYHFVQKPGDPTVYMIDNGQKHAVGSPDILTAWSFGGVVGVQGVSQGTLDVLPTGAALASFVANQGSNDYIMSGQKVTIPSALQTPYTSGKTLFSASANLLSMYATGAQASKFIQAAGQPTVYIPDAGLKRPVKSLEDYVLWGGGPGLNTILPQGIVNWYSNSAALGSFVSYGGVNYLLDGGTKRQVSTQVQGDWGLSGADGISQELLNSISAGTALDSDAKIGNVYYLIRGKAALQTSNIDMAGVWSIDDAVNVSPININRLTQKGLTRFSGSSDSSDHRIFIVDKTSLYLLNSPEQVFNMGYKGEPLVQISPSEVTSRGVNSSWDNFLGKDGASTNYVFDNGLKHRFADNNSQNQWTNNGSYGVTGFSNNFLNLLPNSPTTLTKSLRAGDLAVYAGVNGQKRLIQSPSTYQSQYAPLTEVSPLLKDTLPSGSTIP